jgi:murein tripeptide amidase MpaA
MNFRHILTLAVATLTLALGNCMEINAQNPPIDWTTPAERDNFRTTPDFQETFKYLSHLDRAVPEIKLTTFGKSGEGRDLLLVIADKNKQFMPADAKKNGKVVVFLQACIHAGESDGKDAGMALLRDIYITKKFPNLLDNIVLVFAPVYNVDGHERRSPYNRINQNGPNEMGWRGNARNINLNRDYIKADEPETVAWHKLWNEWQPDLFIDSHVTDGADYRYNITYQYERHYNISSKIKDWYRLAFETRIVRNTEKEGHLLGPYFTFEDNRDFSKGIYEFSATPRFATGYVPLKNRPAILIESHSLKEHGNRVKGTYDFIREILTEVNKNPKFLLDAVRESENFLVKYYEKYDPVKTFVLSTKLTRIPDYYYFRGYERVVLPSEISGTNWVQYDRNKPKNESVPFFRTPEIVEKVIVPTAYIIPPQWSDVINRIKLHGLEFETISAPRTIKVEAYRINSPKFATNSFESRIMLREFKAVLSTETRTFPQGSVIVRTNQPNAQVLIHLLEPNAPDSLLRWGFFNSIFEQKEYGEPYIVEKIAREMLKKDEALKKEFEERLKTDEAFAKSSQARLNFFFERSPYFDTQIGLYPVGRIIE